MAIENTTANAVKGGVSALLSKLGLHTTANENQSASSPEIGNEAATSGQSLPSLFASLLSIENQSGGADASDGEISSNAYLSTQSKDLTNTVSNTQDALPLISGITNANSALSDDAIAIMQNTLLNALQNSVFQSLVANNDTTVNATSGVQVNSDGDTVSSNQSDAPSTLFDSLYTGAFGEDGLDLRDGFDVLNIANHLPVVSDIYEETTSNQTAAAASLAGSFLYGGIGGLMYNAIDLAVENVSGQSISNHIWTMGQSLLASVFNNVSSDSNVNTDTSGTPQSQTIKATTLIETDDIATGLVNKGTDAAYQFVQRSFN